MGEGQGCGGPLVSALLPVLVLRQVGCPMPHGLQLDLDACRRNGQGWGHMPRGGGSCLTSSSWLTPVRYVGIGKARGVWGKLCVSVTSKVRQCQLALHVREKKRQGEGML